MPPTLSERVDRTILVDPQDAMGLDTFELQYSKGRWLAPLEVIDELYDTLLRLPAKGQTNYITLGSCDSDVEIYCARKRSELVREPFAYTEEQAKSKLSAWLEKRGLTGCDQATNTETMAANDVVGDPAAENVSSAVDEAGAVRCLRERGYIVVPPCTSARNPGAITPPPPYTLHQSSSQPVQSVAVEAATPATLAIKRKRGDDRDAARAASCPSTPMHRSNSIKAAQTRDKSQELVVGDSDAEEEIISGPLRKKRRTTRTNKTRTTQKPTTPPRCAKTKSGTLTSTISYEAAAEVTGVGQKTVNSPHTDAENDADVSESDERERPAAGEGDQAVSVCSSLPKSTPEEIGALNLLSLHGSAANASPARSPVDQGEDSLFVPENARTEPEPVEPVAIAQHGETLSRAESPSAAPPQTGDDEDGASVSGWSASDRTLYRYFCKDVQTAEEQWDHHKVRQAMAKLREREPLLRPTFLRCLAIARKTMGERVICEWRKFQEQGWEKRRAHGSGIQGLETAPPAGSLPTPDPAWRDLVAAAYREFQEIFKAKTNDWKAHFQYRRAAVRLTGQYEAYAVLHDQRSSRRPSAPQHDRSMLLRTLFREMHPDWRNALASNFTDKQVKEQGYGYEWKTFVQTIQDGRRWTILTEHLGLGALLLIDTSGSNVYVQRQVPMPVFAAWVRLISRVRLDVNEVAARVVGYFDGMEDPSFYTNRKLRPLKLERRAYRACSPGEQFDFSGSEGSRTPTVDPGCLSRPGDGVVYGGDCLMDEFIESSPVKDDDFDNLLGLDA